MMKAEDKTVNKKKAAFLRKYLIQMSQLLLIANDGGLRVYSALKSRRDVMRSLQKHKKTKLPFKKISYLCEAGFSPVTTTKT